jgi:hypothetical protein
MLRLPQLLFIAVVLCLDLVAGCSPPPVEGVYVFRSNDVEERLEIRPKGYFVQTIKMGEHTYAVEGSWWYKDYELIFRSDFLVRFDGSTGRLLAPPLKVSRHPARWEYRRKRITFDVNRGDQYYVEKVQ